MAIEDEDSALQEALQNKKVFSSRDGVAGMPVSVFGLCAAFVLVFAWLSIQNAGWKLGIPASVLFAGVVFCPIYWVHVEDLQAYKIWMRCMAAPSRYACNQHKVRKVRIVTKSTGELVPLINFHSDAKDQ